MGIRIPRSEFENDVPDHVGKTRIKHDGDHCSGDSLSMIVERTEDGYARAHCFRCGGRGSFELVRHYRHHDTADRAAGKASERGIVAADQRLVGLERVASSDHLSGNPAFPAEGKAWFAKSGFNLEYADSKGCRWSDREHCLFIPVVREGLSAFGDVIPGYVRRKWSPKTYNVLRIEQEPLWGLYRGPEVLPHWVGDRKPVVIVEDTLSAWRVSEVMDSIALCGTELHSAVISALFHEGYTDAVVWLDADNPIVRAKARKIANRINGLARTHMIETGSDPKHENAAQVEERLLAVLDTA